MDECNQKIRKIKLDLYIQCYGNKFIKIRKIINTMWRYEKMKK